jgi:hypothetical protein
MYFRGVHQKDTLTQSEIDLKRLKEACHAEKRRLEGIPVFLGLKAAENHSPFE